MGVKNSALLEDGQYKDLHPGINAESGEVADVAEASVEAFWHEGQPADLSKGLSLTTVQRFFDYIPRRVFLPSTPSSLSARRQYSVTSAAPLSSAIPLP